MASLGNTSYVRIVAYELAWVAWRVCVRRTDATACSTGRGWYQYFCRNVSSVTRRPELNVLHRQAAVQVANGGISSVSSPDFRSPETGLYANLEKYNLP